MLYSYSYCKAIEKLSQGKGLRDARYGVPVSPLVFTMVRF